MLRDRLVDVAELERDGPPAVGRQGAPEFLRQRDDGLWDRWQVQSPLSQTSP